MSSMKKYFVLLIVAFFLSATACISMMLIAKEDLRCEPIRNKEFAHQKLNSYKTVECESMITKYTVDIPLLLGLFAACHILHFVRLLLSDVDDLLEETELYKKILGLIVRIIILGVYVGSCAYFYYDIVNLGHPEVFWRDTPSIVPCNATIGNDTVKEECQLLGSTSINKTLMFPLIVSAIIILMYICEVYLIGLKLFFCNRLKRYGPVTVVDH